MNLEKHNPHWKEHFVYPFEVKRDLFARLAQQVNNRLVIAISGLRRTGKTVLLKQLITFLINEQEVPRRNILYFSFDEEQPKIENVLREFEKITSQDIKQGKFFIFLDEIQKLEDWQNQIKFYYDNYSLKFFVSGSSSLFIRKKVKESLAGRCFDFYLPPLHFREFLLFRGKKELLEKPSLFVSELEKELGSYMKRQFIEVVSEPDDFVAEYVQSILEKVIYIDIPNVFVVENLELLRQLMKIIAAQPGMIIEYESLSKEMGMNRTTLSNYLFYLEEAFLIKKIYNFSKNRLTSEKKAKKFYLNCTSFFPYLCPDIGESLLVENLIALETGSRFFWRTPSKEEVDFILEENTSFFPLEVKWKQVILPREFRGLIKFCRKFQVCRGGLISKNIEEKKTVYLDGSEVTIEVLPAWKWLSDHRHS